MGIRAVSFKDMGIKVNQNEVKLGDRTFLVQKQPVKTYWADMITIGRIVGVPFSFLTKALTTGDIGECAPQFMELLFTNLEEDGFIELCGYILKDVHLNGSAVNIDVAFEEKPEELLLLVLKVLEVRYSGLGKLDFGSLTLAGKILSTISMNQKQSED